LRYLIRLTREAAICIVITYRENEPATSESSKEILQKIRREFAVKQIRLDGLDEDHVRRFIEAYTHRAAPQWLAELIIKTTEGNPLFVTEMLAHFGETRSFADIELSERPIALTDIGLPKDIRQLIRCRLAQLSPVCRTLLTLEAVISRKPRFGSWTFLL
jgi:predicted ATPase